ncbi:MAG: hypothetical protein V7L09_33495 [Nostoc sp.]|uniref:hypothetical protein n=1 Tax=Nostoc sp. TaxID=1180 RepID=UPI002FEFA61B
MKIDLATSLTIILGLLALIGSIYKVAQVEANINARISRIEASTLLLLDSSKNDLIDRMNIIDNKLQIQITEYKSDKEYIFLYRLNSIEKTVEHKFNRLASWITQLSGYLHKESGFQIRDDKF